MKNNMTNTFLPKGEKIPETKSSYFKLKEGANKFRIVSDAVTGYEYWTEEKKPVRLKEKPQEKPKDIRLNDDGSYTIKYFWAFSVLDRESGTVKILELTQTGVMRQLQEVINDPEWGDPKEYDVNITGKGEGMERRYTVIPSPHKTLTAEEKSLVARTEINIEALFQGEDPFNSSKLAPVEEVKLSDVPF